VHFQAVADAVAAVLKTVVKKTCQEADAVPDVAVNLDISI
jgi:hypothetical protein